MKRFSKKKRILLVVLAVCIGLSVFLLASTNSTKDSEESIAVTEGFLGAYATMSDLTAYTSPDGLTSSLSEAELDAQIEAYNQRVDQYYAKGCTCNKIYKDWHRYNLETAFKSKVHDILDNQCSVYEQKSVDFNEDKNEAVLSCVILSWTKGVERDENTGKYQAMQNPAGTDSIKAKMVKEDGSWKLLAILENTPLSVWRSDNLVKDAVLKSDKVSRANTAEAETCQREIQKNEKILDTQYDTYQEARDAVASMDMEHGNYYALAKLCDVDLSGVHNGD